MALGSFRERDPNRLFQPQNSPAQLSMQGYQTAANTMNAGKGGYTQTTEGPGKTLGGAAMAGISGLTTGVMLAGGLEAAIPLVGATHAAGAGMMGGMMAVPGVGWALGAAMLGAYLLS